MFSIKDFEGNACFASTWNDIVKMSKVYDATTILQETNSESVEFISKWKFMGNGHWINDLNGISRYET